MNMQTVLGSLMALIMRPLQFLKNRSKKQLVLILVALGLGWYGYQYFFGSSKTETRYVLGAVEKRTIVSSVSASGQIAASNELTVQSKASGEIVSLRVEPGDKVSTGETIAYIDSTDAEKAVRDAQTNLESAKIALAKIKKPATVLTKTQAENALINAQDSLQKTYTDSNTHVVNAFLDFPDIITSLEGILTNSDANKSQWNLDYYQGSIELYDNRSKGFRDTAYEDFILAKKQYDTAFAKYHALGVSPSPEVVADAAQSAYSASQAIAKALKSSNAFISLYVDTLKTRSLNYSPVAANALVSLNSYTGKVNTHATNLLTDTNAIKQYKQSIIEKQQALEDINDGADSLDIESAQLSVTKAENALIDARHNLADYAVTAPFGGMVSAVAVKKHQTVGSGTQIATIVSPQQVAQLSLNEVDAAKIKVGDKATLTFDAIEGLSLTGKVVHIDPVGAVSQGVVSYTVEIGFDTQDARVKPGMTVNASIITAIHPDVLSVPAGAVKNQRGQLSVQVFNPALVVPKATDTASTQTTEGVVSEKTPESITITIGISDDTYTEVLTGLTEGQQIIERTITQKAATTTAPSLFGGPPGGNRNSGQGTRTGGNNR